MRIFKSEMDEMKDDKKELPSTEQQQAQNLAQPQSQPKTEQQPNE